MCGSLFRSSFLLLSLLMFVNYGVFFPFFDSILGQDFLMRFIRCAIINSFIWSHVCSWANGPGLCNSCEHKWQFRRSHTQQRAPWATSFCPPFDFNRITNICCRYAMAQQFHAYAMHSRVILEHVFVLCWDEQLHMPLGGCSTSYTTTDCAAASQYIYLIHIFMLVRMFLGSWHA